ncbi:uncharacterized protein LOC122298864 [Carya illinoinensis]|uniref:uncharacterized protein LOC122298864 n=1 Tax=Carya illinoinensis TaxID=32201 RepID=UPI001C721DC9|nr:uncharacterized protein LOC122298864 [Carya illinoinensis]
MNFISWNCRGFGNPQTIQDLCLMAKEKKANVIFLIEIMIKGGRLESMKRRLGMEGCLAVDPVGKKGGLVLFWRYEEEVKIKNYSSWHINAEIREEGKGKSWLFTGIYGHPETGKRKLSWDLLRSFKPNEKTPWCVMGDFNEILFQNEKVGGRQRSESQLIQFREMMEDNLLYDLGCCNGFYTWSNRHSNVSFIKERLDRCVANKEWREMFRGTRVEGLPVRSSDHLPLLVSIRGVTERQRSWYVPFKFEASWVREDECELKIRQVWNDGILTEDVVTLMQSRLRLCSGMLRESGRIAGTGGYKVEIKSKEELDGVAEAFKTHFDEVYRTENLGVGKINKCLAEMEKKVTAEMNEVLERDFKREEVEEALKMMGSLKSPGPDGFGACFFQSFWHIVGSDVCGSVLQFLNGGRLDEGLNYTYIALIPKVSDPKSVNEFRPISLCNVVYKLIAKTLANRLKKVMDAIISRNQSAFIPGRVEWSYLEAVMKKLGFGSRWIGLIMQCISSVSYAALINGKPGETIKPTRGLRQGDPLSPYLFLLCSEGLSAMLNNTERRSELKRVSVARGGIRVTHLLFADDCIIFGKASWKEWKKIRSILDLYEEASRQSLNKEKTTIFFSRRAQETVKEGIMKNMGARQLRNSEKYLGLQIMVGRSKYNSFRVIKDRVWKKISN